MAAGKITKTQIDKQQPLGDQTEGDSGITSLKHAVDKKIENVMQSVDKMEKDGTYVSRLIYPMFDYSPLVQKSVLSSC